MSRTAIGMMYAGVLAAVIVTVDVLVFRHHFWARLAANVGIVLLAAAIYLRFRR